MEEEEEEACAATSGGSSELPPVPARPGTDVAYRSPFHNHANPASSDFLSETELVIFTSCFVEIIVVGGFIVCGIGWLRYSSGTEPWEVETRTMLVITHLARPAAAPDHLGGQDRSLLTFYWLPAPVPPLHL